MKLRVAIVGLGNIGNTHGRVYQGREDCEIVAVCDIIEEAGRARAEEFQVEYVPTTEELYARDDVQAVGICVQTPQHYELAMGAIEAGRHLLSEKPMAASIAQAREMRDAAEEKGLCAAISYQLRMSPVFNKMKEICEQINPLQVLFARQRAMMSDKYLSPAPFDGIMDFISHDIDMVPHLAGRPPTAVFASFQRDTWAEAGAIELIGAQVEMGEGNDKAIGYISSSQGGGGVPQRLDVIGENGLAVATGNSIRFSTDPNPATKDDTRDMWSVSFEGQGRDFTVDLYQHWAAHILNPDLDLAPVASYADGYNALLLSLAIVESGESGEKIDLAQFAAANE